MKIIIIGLLVIACFFLSPCVFGKSQWDMSADEREARALFAFIGCILTVFDVVIFLVWQALK